MYDLLVLVLWIIVAKYVVLNFISNNCAYIVFRPFYWLTDSRVYIQTIEEWILELHIYIMTTIDLSPLYRSTIGFDRLASLLDSTLRSESNTGYPPYNIESKGENKYSITLAVAGFNNDELDAQVENGVLTDWFLFCDNSMRIAPPLNITDEEIRFATDAILKAIGWM